MIAESPKTIRLELSVVDSSWSIDIIPLLEPTGCSRLPTLHRATLTQPDTRLRTHSEHRSKTSLSSCFCSSRFLFELWRVRSGTWSKNLGKNQLNIERGHASLNPPWVLAASFQKCWSGALTETNEPNLAMAQMSTGKIPHFTDFTRHPFFSKVHVQHVQSQTIHAGSIATL